MGVDGVLSDRALHTIVPLALLGSSVTSSSSLGAPSHIMHGKVTSKCQSNHRWQAYIHNHNVSLTRNKCTIASRKIRSQCEFGMVVEKGNLLVGPNDTLALHL